MAYLDEKQNVRLIKSAYNEQDILYLNETFLTTGFHVISVPSFEFGRSLMHTFLQSLNYYTNIACVSKSDIIEPSVHNIYQLLAEKDIDGLNQYLIEEFDYDFLWIEEEASWKSRPWYLEFENSIKEQHIDKFSPIIVLKVI